MAPPIIMMKIAGGYAVPTIEWPSYSSCSSLNDRLQKRIYGRLRGKALEKAIKVVMENGGRA